MKVLETLLKKVVTADDEISQTVMLSVLAKEREVVELNTDEQLFTQGVSANGAPIRPVYTPMTVAIKQAKGQPTDRVTLRDTGDFHQSFFIEISDKEFTINADDPKLAKIQRKYGSNVLGLTQTSIDQTADIIRPTFVQIVRKQILE